MTAVLSLITQYFSRPVGIPALADITRHFDVADAPNEFVRWLADLAYAVLDLLGLNHHPHLALVVYCMIVLAMAIGIGLLIKWGVRGILHLTARRVKSDFIRIIIQGRFITSLTDIIPPLIYLTLLHFTVWQYASLTKVLENLTLIYIIFRSVMAASAFVNVVWVYFDSRQNKRKLPLKGLAQLVVGLFWIIGIIIIVAILVNKSPATLLAGLGAFAAVLMLVFKDSILGVVAGVQLSQEDSLHVGDWISVPSNGTNGTVEEVNLGSIKVRNWDNTTTMLPPYSLVSGSFVNYQSMVQGGARRIQRTFMIDADSLRFLEDADLEEFKSIPYMKDWIEAKQKQRMEGREYSGANPEGLVDGTIDTNLGLLRAYLKMYLDHNADIDHTQTCFVCTLQQTNCGIPLQIYCFTSTSAWIAYESIQSAVFEHVAVVLARFRLCTFENPSGRDTIETGYITGRTDVDSVLGAPDPYFVPVRKSVANAAPPADKHV